MTRHHKRRRTRRIKKGGFWPFTTSETNTTSYSEPSYSSQPSDNGIGNTISSAWSNVSQGASDLWDKAKKSVSGNANSTALYNPPAPAPVQSSYMGGKRHKKRGGTMGWTPLTGIASHAADFFGKSAQPQVWVGGRRKTKRRVTRKRRSTRRR